MAGKLARISRVRMVAFRDNGRIKFVMITGENGSRTWRWALLGLGFIAAVLVVAIISYTKVLAVSIAVVASAVAIFGTVATVVVWPSVRWARDSGTEATLRHRASDHASALAGDLLTLANGVRPADWHARMPQWRAADVEHFLTGERLPPWDFVADLHAMLTVLKRWGPSESAEARRHLLQQWRSADGTARQVRRRARGQTLTLAGATALVAALAVVAAAVIYTKGHSGTVAVWKARLDGPVSTTPAVAGHKVYVATDDTLYALDAATGSVRWQKSIGVHGGSSPVVVGGMVIIANREPGIVYAFDAATGKQLWSFQAEDSIDSSPAVMDGVVYIGCDGGRLYAINAARGGNAREPTYVGGEVNGRPAIAAGNVYIGSAHGALYSVNATSGNPNEPGWPAPTGGPISESSPAVADNLVFVGSGDGKVYAFNEFTGEQAWAYPTGEAVESSPTVVKGVVYVGSNSGELYALAATHEALLWEHNTGGYVQSQPAVVNGVVYFGSDDDNVYAVSTVSHMELWRFPTRGHVESSPVVSSGTVYIGSDDGTMYALNAAKS